MTKKKQIRVGIDIGGTKMLAAAIDEKNKILSSVKAKTITEEGEEYFSSTLTDMIQRALDEAKVPQDQLSAIGIGCPGIIDAEKTHIINSPNMPFLNDYPLGKKLQRYFHVPVAVENDVNIGLYGEYRFGVGKGYRHIAGFFLGTGIGGALILDGKLYRGATGAAGELGHIFTDPLGPMCGCGTRGCLEALVGRPAIAGEAAIIAMRGHAPALMSKTGSDLRAIKSGALARAVETEKEIRELLVFKASVLGIAMGSIVNILNPELIVLGGGVVEAMPALIVSAADASMRKHSIPALSEKVKVVAAQLGDHAIVLGAAQMAAERG